MIPVVYNIVSRKYNAHPIVEFNLFHVSNARGNIYKMQLIHVHYNLRKYFFSNKILALWNGLPNKVIFAESTKIYKNRLSSGLIKNQNMM